MQFGLEVIGNHRDGVSGAGRYRETIHIVGQGALGQLEIVRPRVQDLLRCRENVARSKVVSLSAALDLDGGPTSPPTHLLLLIFCFQPKKCLFYFLIFVTEAVPLTALGIYNDALPGPGWRPNLLPPVKV